WLHRGRPVLRQTFQIQDPADQVRFLLHPPAAAPPEAPQAVPVLGFPEQLLDQLPTALREPICLAASPHAHPSVRDGAASWYDGNVRRDPPTPKRCNKVLVKESSVRAERGGAEPQSSSRTVEQSQTAPLLRGRALEDLHAEPEQEPMPVLHHGVDGIA